MALKSPVRLATLVLALWACATGWAQTPKKTGYTVLVEIQYNEQGVPEDATVVQSEDITGDHALEQIALHMAAQDHQPPRVQNGQAVKFKARRPFFFPVEDDEGPAANAERPVLRSGHQTLPAYPPELAARDVVGGAIVELMIRADGTVASTRTLRASHPEFAKAAEDAMRQWTFNPRDNPGLPAESRWRAAVAFTTRGRVPEVKWRVAPRPSLGGFVVGHIPPEAPPQPAPAAAPAAEKK